MFNQVFLAAMAPLLRTWTNILLFASCKQHTKNEKFLNEIGAEEENLSPFTSDPFQRFWLKGLLKIRYPCLQNEKETYDKLKRFCEGNGFVYVNSDKINEESLNRCLLVLRMAGNKLFSSDLLVFLKNLWFLNTHIHTLDTIYCWPFL